MQDLTAAPNMASPYTPAGGGNAPVQSGLGGPPAAQPSLGTPIPGTTGGLPAKPGLTVYNNPLPQPLQSQPNEPQNPQAQQSAQHTQSYGRGQDTMLVHMTPDEVNSLRGLAQQFGGDLTQNPHTGLPEAGWLGKLLPTILGGVLAATGVGAPLAAGLVGLGTGAITGDLKQGLMAGLGAFGGASLAGAAGLGGAISNNAFGALGSKAGILGANMGAGAAVAPTVAAGGVAPAVADYTGNAGLNAAANAVANQGANAAAKTGIGGFIQNFSNTAKAGLPGGIIGKAAPILAAQGLVSGIGGAMSPGTSGTVNQQTGAIDNSYQGPYYAQERKATFAPTTEELLKSSKQRAYFDVAMPEIYNTQGQVVQAGSNTAPGTEIWQPVLNTKAKKGQPMYSFAPTYWKGVQPQQDPSQIGYAEGGTVNMDEGGFVIPARAVAEAGNGYTDAGFERFAKMGGIPLRGKGDGVSDDIPARIGDQEARVAAGEVYMPPEAVRKAGGAKKLYALVNQAHKARKRGENSSVAKGLGAL
jgi:hypothetical protein